MHPSCIGAPGYHAAGGCIRCLRAESLNGRGQAWELRATVPLELVRATGAGTGHGGGLLSNESKWLRVERLEHIWVSRMIPVGPIQVCSVVSTLEGRCQAKGAEQIFYTQPW